MKSISLAIICHFERNVPNFSHHYQGIFHPQILLMAYAIDNEETPHVIDLTNEKRLPQKIFSILCNPRITKYTHNSDFTRECLIRNFNYNFTSENWRSLSSVTSYLRMPDTLEELSVLFNLETMDFAHIDYCKRVFCYSHTVKNKKLRIHSSEYPVLWNHLKEYCKWLVLTECIIRKLLFVFPCSDLCHLSSALHSKISKNGVPINRELLYHLQNDFSNKLNILCSKYEQTKMDCEKHLTPETYNQLLEETHKIEQHLKKNYCELEVGVSSNSRYHTPFTNTIISDIPQILYDVVIPDKNCILACIDFTPIHQTIMKNLYENFSDKEQIIRAIKYVLYTKSTYSLKQFTLEYQCGCLCVYSNYDSTVVYPNVTVIDNNDYLFSYFGYNAYHQWSQMYCTLDDLINHIATAIQANMIATFSLQYETIAFRTLSFSKHTLLLSVPFEKQSLLQEVFEQCLIQTRT